MMDLATEGVEGEVVSAEEALLGEALSMLNISMPTGGSEG